MEIGVAYAARFGLYKDFASSRRGNVLFLEFQGFYELLDNSCVHFGRHVSMLLILCPIGNSSLSTEYSFF